MRYTSFSITVSDSLAAACGFELGAGIEAVECGAKCFSELCAIGVEEVEAPGAEVATGFAVACCCFAGGAGCAPYFFKSG